MATTTAEKIETILRIEDVSLTFGKVVALVDVNFDVRKGDILAIIGPNGAGKTCLLNCVNGFYRPQEGTIYFDGTAINRLPRHKIAKLGVARTFQNINLYTHLNVLDNLLAGRHIFMTSGPVAGAIYFGKVHREEVEHREMVERVIDLLDMEPIRKAIVGFLPYGMRKRVELARAVAMEPKLLLLDEPMAGMNVEEKEDMARYILDVHELWGTTVMIIEHDMEVAMDIASRMVVLDFGHKITEGSPQEIMVDPRVIAAYLGEPSTEV